MEKKSPPINKTLSAIDAQLIPQESVHEYDHEY